MRIKQFVAQDTPTAMTQIKAELGHDAVILSSYEKDGQTFVTAAVEEADISHPAPPHPAQAAHAPSSSKGWSLEDFLFAHGTTQDLCAKLVDSAAAMQSSPFSGTDILEMLLGKMVNFKSPAQSFERGKAHILIGPTGVGKTTFLSKLAIQAKANGDRIGLISLDDKKIGGFEPLAIIAENLGESAHLISNDADITTAAKAIGKRNLILIDTPGISPYRPQDITQLHNRLKALKLDPVVHLVTPASFNPTEMACLPAAYNQFNPANIIFTKLDETTKFGGILNVGLESGIGICYATHAASLNHTPSVLNNKTLARMLTQRPKSPWEAQ